MDFTCGSTDGRVGTELTPANGSEDFSGWEGKLKESNELFAEEDFGLIFCETPEIIKRENGSETFWFADALGWSTLHSLSQVEVDWVVWDPKAMPGGEEKGSEDAGGSALSKSLKTDDLLAAGRFSVSGGIFC